MFFFYRTLQRIPVIAKCFITDDEKRGPIIAFLKFLSLLFVDKLFVPFLGEINSDKIKKSQSFNSLFSFSRFQIMPEEAYLCE